MDVAVPLIYTRGDQPERLPARFRLVALGIALGCLTLVTTAALLDPSPEGVGSHTAMGFPRCQFLERTGLPCPSCGMTTSWVWFARGNVVASVYVQPMGAVLAMLAAACVWVGAYAALTGRPVYRLLRVVPGQYYFVPLIAVAIAAWAWKIFIHLHGLDGWR